MTAAITDEARDLHTYSDSYKDLASLHAWSCYMFEGRMAESAHAFHVEAKNDALTSHVLAVMGVWRASLQTLRACIENALCAQFFKDHPVENELRDAGQYRKGFSDLLAYFRSHPGLAGLDERVSGLDLLGGEYAKLSMAVHGSSDSYRMTTETGAVQMFVQDDIRMRQWRSRERNVLIGLNCLLTCLYRSQLSGSQKPALRESIGAVLPAGKRDAIKDQLGVFLPGI
ncbi:hypothetical protein [Alienimonas californiensis]|nr:hypothetical protein [Alienimonas californiensis]